MALDDRDRRFDQALARQLPLVCAEAETLAAYHDRLLSPEEMAVWKSHVRGCVRCQEILAQLEATESILEETDAEREVVAAAAPVALMKATVAGAPSRASVRTMASAKETARRPASTYARWLAPAGALAAGLLLWIAVGGRKPALPLLEEKTASNQAAAPQTEPPAKRRDELPPAPEPPRAGRAAGVRSGLAAKEAEESYRALDENRKLLEQAQSNEGQLLRQSTDATRAQQYESDALNKDLQAASQAKPKQSPAADLKLNSRERGAILALAPRLAEPAPPPPASAPLEAAADQPGEPALPDAKNDRAAVGGASESVEVLREERVPLRAATMSRQKAEKEAAKKQDNARIVPAPGGNTVWSIGAGGVILRSTNGGKKWKQQPSGVAADLAAGSAATDAVCWVVGREGTILLTIDGGSHWMKLPAPINGDIGGVFAVDAVHAMIWDGTNHRSFETDDGGRSWKPSTTP